MKRRWTALLLCLAVFLTSSAAVSAAETEESGFYRVDSTQEVTVVPLTAAGEAVTPVMRGMGETGENTLFYPGSEALRVTLRETVQGKLYLLTVCAGDTVLYAEQQTGGGTLSFTAAFRLPERETELRLNIGSNAPGYVRRSLALAYTPGAKDAGYQTCPRDEGCVLSAFADLSRGAWYHDGVHWALETGVMRGVGSGVFAPNESTSRAMLVTVLYRLEAEPAVGGALPFRDVPKGRWYSDAIRWAAAEHLVEGYGNGIFAPDRALTREELVTILCRYARRKGDDGRGAALSAADYADAGRISGWAAEAIFWAVDAGLVKGFEDGTLRPGAEASRAQTAELLLRFHTS